MEPAARPLIWLPKEMIFEILKRLDVKSIWRFKQTCRMLRHRVDEFEDTYKDLMRRKAEEYESDLSDYGDYDNYDDGGWDDQLWGNLSDYD